MDNLLKDLEQYGCKDLPTTMDRFLNDEEFYVEMARQTIEDAGFERLGENLKEGDAEKAFDSAHMLKGIIANCGISPLFDIMEKIVEPLRKGNCEGLLPVYDELMKERARFSRVINAAHL